MYCRYYGTQPLKIINEKNGCEYFDYCQFDIIIGNDIISRTDRNLIESILHVGLEQANDSHSSIYLEKVPTALVQNMKIGMDYHENMDNPFSDIIECDIGHAYRLIREDETIETIVDIRQRMLEIDFSNIVFKNFHMKE